MRSRYENVPLPVKLVRKIDFMVDRLGHTSRPEFLKRLVLNYIDELVRIKLLLPDEIRPFFRK